MVDREPENKPESETHKVWTDEQGAVHHQRLAPSDPRVLRRLLGSIRLSEGTIIPSHKFLEDEEEQW